jgi:hypothetical protein
MPENKPWEERPRNFKYINHFPSKTAKPKRKKQKLSIFKDVKKNMKIMRE